MKHGELKFTKEQLIRLATIVEMEKVKFDALTQLQAKDKQLKREAKIVSELCDILQPA
jgi:translation elongation factor EF-4